MSVPDVLILVSLVLFYLTYRLLKSDQVVLKYFLAAFLIFTAVLFIIAAIKYVTPSTVY